ncbi:MAG: hypothetical protein IPF99_26065 [Deltaproteobacteria bacterium]|nr:hypothetical protein [Deltaproteobacteria bacterium]
MEANIQAIKKNSREWLRARGVAAIDKVAQDTRRRRGEPPRRGRGARRPDSAGRGEAVGRASFDEICTEDLGIHPSTARRWMALATRLRRRFVLDVGIDRARALMELADAT